MASTENEKPWHEAYPAPKEVNPKTITRAELLALLKENGGSISGGDFVLVDLRRMDHKGGTIRGSINLPAQSLYPSIPTLYQIFKAAGVRKVIWYCGSSSGRGPRAAGWFSDYITERGDSSMQSLVLLGGIKGWAKDSAEFTEFIDGYDPVAWMDQ
ncbi:hypothetical protein DL765_004031 [Monosporascus sp. GIB2]|nr:hypothetical protein DL765_004031 [Monosporascus sp. GIB2]